MKILLDTSPSGEIVEGAAARIPMFDLYQDKYGWIFIFDPVTPVTVAPFPFQRITAKYFLDPTRLDATMFESSAVSQDEEPGIDAIPLEATRGYGAAAFAS